MKRITLISDTHSYLGDEIIEHCNEADEIWHAGDVGSMEVLEQLESIAPTIGVYGNIDDRRIRSAWPLNQLFECEGVQVFMTHIGGYPPRYTKRVRALLEENSPDLYICGHSHICKVMPDKKLDLLHMNPGACGHVGFHKMRTILKFECSEGKVQNLRVVELGLRGILNSNATEDIHFQR